MASITRPFALGFLFVYVPESCLDQLRRDARPEASPRAVANVCSGKMGVRANQKTMASKHDAETHSSCRGLPPRGLFTDQVMGGVSKGTMVRDAVAGRAAIRMRGDLSLENNGGFVQIALDLSPDGGVVDASAWSGIELDVFGNGEEYGVHLRTDALTRPWQSYRQIFSAYAEWRTVQLPFDHFVPHRTDVLLDSHRLRRIGVVAIGRAFSADLALGGLRFMALPRSVREPSS